MAWPIVAVAKASATLGDPFNDPYPAKSVLIVDEKANEDQKCALVEFAKAMGGRLLENVVLVQSAPISLEVGEASKHGSVVLQAGKLARIQTRAIGDKDHLCGNEIYLLSSTHGALTRHAGVHPVRGVSRFGSRARVADQRQTQRVCWNVLPLSASALIASRLLAFVVCANALPRWPEGAKLA